MTILWSHVNSAGWGQCSACCQPITSVFQPSRPHNTIVSALTLLDLCMLLAIQILLKQILKMQNITR